MMFWQSLLLVVLGGGLAAALIGLVTHVLLQRSRSRDQLRAAYVEYLSAVELVERSKVKSLGDTRILLTWQNKFSEAEKYEPTNEQEAAAQKRHMLFLLPRVEDAGLQHLRSTREFFDTRAAVIRTHHSVRLLEADDDFEERVNQIGELLGRFIRPSEDTEESPKSESTEETTAKKHHPDVDLERRLGRDIEKLVDDLRNDHPRIAAKPTWLRWLRWWWPSSLWQPKWLRRRGGGGHP